MARAYSVGWFTISRVKAILTAPIRRKWYISATLLTLMALVALEST